MPPDGREPGNSGTASSRGLANESACGWRPSQLFDDRPHRWSGGKSTALTALSNTLIVFAQVNLQAFFSRKAHNNVGTVFDTEEERAALAA